MNLSLGLLLVCSFAAATLGANKLTEEEEDMFAWHKKLLEIGEQIERSPRLKAEWVERVRKSKEAPEIPPIDFKCDVNNGRSPERPTSVHALRPGDIDIVAAFGDSISAGNGLGAELLIEVALENRGEVFSIGAQGSLEEGVVTLPNILRKYNPNLKGYATCKSQKENFDLSWFNVAQPGGKANHMYDQAVRLIDAMKGDDRINYAEDWKFLTMFVGGNDLCASCSRNQSAEFWYYSFERALLKLKEEMPRAVVNLVSMFDVTPLPEFSTGLVCDLLQWGFCDCARNTTSVVTLRPLQLAYDEMNQRLADDPRFQSDDFTVIRQPQMRDMEPPRDPETGDYLEGFLSPDCFHPNRIAHQGFAVYLWNTLFIPVGQKPTYFNSSNLNVEPYCPDETTPFIYTWQNSRPPIGAARQPMEAAAGQEKKPAAVNAPASGVNVRPAIPFAARPAPRAPEANARPAVGAARAARRSAMFGRRGAA